MKKIISAIMIALCACVFAGCAKKQETNEVPKFTSDKVNAYLSDYAAYCGEAEQIYKDPQRIAQVPAKMEEFSKRQNEVRKELVNEAEVNAFNKCVAQIRDPFEKVRMRDLKPGGAK